MATEIFGSCSGRKGDGPFELFTEMRGLCRSRGNVGRKRNENTLVARDGNCELLRLP